MVVLRKLFIGILVVMSFMAVGESRVGWAAAGDAATQPKVQTVSVLVRHKGTKEVIQGAKVKVQKAWGLPATLATNDEGIATIPLDLAGKNYLGIGVRFDGVVAMDYSWNPGGPGHRLPPDQIIFDMEDGVSIGGQVVDEAGKPLDHATVAASLPTKPSAQEAGQEEGRPPHFSLWYVATQTDADGNWTLNDFPADLKGIQLAAYHALCLDGMGTYQTEGFKDVAGLAAHTASITLTHGTPLQVSVQTVDGDPVSGARVAIGRERGWATNVVRSAKTDKDGNAMLGFKPGAQTVITVSAKGLAPELKEVTIGTEATTLAFTLKPGFTLTGTVVDGADKPVSHVNMMVDTWRKGRTLQQYLSTDAEGVFTWNEAPEDAVEVSLFKAGYANQEVSVVQGAENKIVLKGPTLVRGTVNDAETGEPVPAFHVVLGFQQDAAMPVNWSQDARNLGAQVPEGRDGKFKFTLTNPYPFFRVRVEAADYLPGDCDAFSLDGKEHVLTYALKKGKPVSGVVTEGGAGVAGVGVYFLQPGVQLQVVNGRIPDYMMREAKRVKTDKDGHFSFSPSDEKYTVLVLTDTGIGQVTRDELAASPTVAIAPWGRVEGTARVGTKTAGHQSVAAYFDGQSGEGADMMLHFSNEAKTDDGGHYVFDKLVPGRYRMGRQVTFGDSGEMRYTKVVSFSMATVEAGKTATVDIGGVGRPVVGKLELPASLKDVKWVCWDAEIRAPGAAIAPVYPANYSTMSVKEKRAWMMDWVQSDAGKKLQAVARARAELPSEVATFSPEGTMRADDVPAGACVLTFTLREMPAMSGRGGFGAPLAQGSKTFTMPAIAGGVSDDPLDVGAIPVILVAEHKAAASQPDGE